MSLHHDAKCLVTCTNNDKSHEGDVGTFFTGFCLCAFLLLEQRDISHSILILGYLMFPVLYDVSITVARRLLKRKPVVKPHKNPDFAININGDAIKLVTEQHKFDSSMVEGDIEKFSALMSILTKAQIDCAVVIYDIFGNEAAFVFTSFVSAYQTKKDKVLVNEDISKYRRRLRAMQLRIDRVERLLNHRDHAVN